MARKYDAKRRLATSLGLKAAKVSERQREWAAVSRRLAPADSAESCPVPSRVRIDFDDLDCPFQIVTRPFSPAGASCGG